MQFFRQFKRMLWLAAWGFWVYLGIGLYRELPRDLSPAVCDLKFGTTSSNPENREHLLGFLDNSHQIASINFQAGKGHHNIRVSNAEDARQDSTWEGPTFIPPVRWYNTKFANATYLVALGRPEVVGASKFPGLSILNLNNGVWTDLGFTIDHNCTDFARHKDGDWMSFIYREANDKRRYAVVDLASAKTIANIPNGDLPTGKRIVAMPLHHIPDSDEFIIQLENEIGGEPELQIWSTTNSGKPDAVIPGIAIEEGSQITADGRIAWHDATTNPPTVCVYDLVKREFVFKYKPPGAHQQITPGRYTAPTLSKDGKSILSYPNGILWDVDSRQKLWVLESGEFLERNDNEIFETRGRLAFKHPFGYFSETVYSVRDLQSGRVLYKCWQPTIPVAGAKSRDGKLVVYPDGRVHETPPRVNWSMLALLQALLASPLVFAWAIGWMRRRRIQKSLNLA